MKHRKPRSLILLGACSQCTESFQDGAARYMLGAFPVEQFCGYECADDFLEDATGKRRFHPLPVSANVRDTLLGLE